MSDLADSGSASERGAQTGVDALRELSAYREPGASARDHEHPSDHLALLYEDRTEQYAAVVPFVRQGLERGERCLYVADEHSRAEVLDALRAGGIDVGEAVDSGALKVLTRSVRYDEDGAFDVEASLATLREALDEAEAEFEGVRAVGEEAWLLEPGAPVDEFMRYESRVNELLEDRGVTAMCQYDRERFPPEILRDVIRTHPYVLDGTTLSRNVYYTPPGEFLGDDEPDAAVDRMIRTLGGRADD